MISNLKTSCSGTLHGLGFEKYVDRYLGAFYYRFNRRFDLNKMIASILRVTYKFTPEPESLLRSVELDTYSCKRIRN